jgi:hypothetical protein
VRGEEHVGGKLQQDGRGRERKEEEGRGRKSRGGSRELVTNSVRSHLLILWPPSPSSKPSPSPPAAQQASPSPLLVARAPVLISKFQSEHWTRVSKNLRFRSFLKNIGRYFQNGVKLYWLSKILNFLAVYSMTVEKEDVATSGYTQFFSFTPGATCKQSYVKGMEKQKMEILGHFLFLFLYIFNTSDFDECVLGTDNCPQVCTNAPPPTKFLCSCSFGYTGPMCTGNFSFPKQKSFSLFLKKNLNFLNF